MVNAYTTREIVKNKYLFYKLAIELFSDIFFFSLRELLHETRLFGHLYIDSIKRRLKKKHISYPNNMNYLKINAKSSDRQIE